ncbi:hypothetical protein GTW66_11220 [Streptomyces sp. SID5473]|uniref:Uncharacterized protein n=2 Tax=Streptomyces TaxID=1883 RepID=I2N7C2_STRT9|nr:hypothetical protein B7R87_25495 [Streptomyces tsukubensis]EIF92919.1 hypothetical protein [Streptomyces tsukubensis NRRL18488]MYS64626.1 hypothetical protein [Streptomyces sp. SID5473]QKM67162.1 hypothetical protein STSU_008275 [Streptomyces tsukubensis NRRL18488]TAI42168.1 hypothetical protein EWI31_23125 [Streptomyces tsukubensis]
MAWEEWDELKASAAERSSGEMQLNGLPDDERPPAVGTGDLQVTQKDLAAVGDHAYKLYNRLWPEVRQAVVPSTDRAGDGLTSQKFALGAALKHVATRWDKQLGTLMDACAHISNHMDLSNKTHRDDDEWIRRSMSSIQTLDRGFDESDTPAGRSGGTNGGKKKA